MKLSLSLPLVLLASVVSATAHAQDDFAPDTRKVKYLERTEITFDGVDVTGELVGPSVIEISERPQAVFIDLIKIRRSFDGEIVASVSAVK